MTEEQTGSQARVRGMGGDVRNNYNITRYEETWYK